MNTSIPDKSYGVLNRNSSDSSIELAMEQIQSIGFAVIDSGYDESQLENLKKTFGEIWEKYVANYGATFLKDIGEYHTIRSLLTIEESEIFLRLAFNKNLHLLLDKLFLGSYILNQQNGVINPSKGEYTQGQWHRDLPYQHFVSSKPVAINALYCVDDFTFENGATFILPASQKIESFPSGGYIKANAKQITAKAGSFIVLDCMLFHAGGYNQTFTDRRGINHIFNIPYFKQQINIPKNLSHKDELTKKEKEILGFDYQEPQNISAYFERRK